VAGGWCGGMSGGRQRPKRRPRGWFGLAENRGVRAEQRNFEVREKKKAGARQRQGQVGGEKTLAGCGSAARLSNRTGEGEAGDVCCWLV